MNSVKLFIMIMVFAVLTGAGITALIEPFDPNKPEPNEPNDYIEWEQEYPIEISLIGDKGTVIFKLGEDNEIICDSTREKYLDVMYEAMSGKEPTGPVILRFKSLVPSE